jgi:2-oxoglutarate dehydrogenase complex dehydrogenase (E1) component-like enzyme
MARVAALPYGARHLFTSHPTTKVSMSHTVRRLVASSILAATLAGTAIADRSQDLQQQINDYAQQAGQYESAGSSAESAGDNAAACRAYRNAASSWRDAANAGTSLIVETLNDSNLDPDIVNENVHIMANNAEADDQTAAKFCN